MLELSDEPAGLQPSASGLQPLMERLYFDYNATTPLLPEVLEAMLPYLKENYGNPSSIHHFGQQARAAVEQARAQVAALINCRPNEIVFTGGGTEADNLAVFGAVRAAVARGPGPKHVVTSAIEHHAVWNACQALEKEGVEVTYLPVGSRGIVSIDDVRRALGPETVLITVMYANNEIGAIQPVAEIAELARAHGVPVHTDAVQAVGKIPVDVKALGVDLLTLSGHKVYAPKGVGALFVRRNTHLQPLSYGGHHERDRRAGTENVAGIVGLGRAAELARQSLAAESRRLAALRDRLERGILEKVPDTAVNGDPLHRIPNTSNLRFDYVEGEALVIALDLKGVACSTGAACSSGAIEPSHVLTAIGLRPEQARASLRFSLGRQTTAEQVDRLLQILPGVVAHLRALSPVYKK
jgi:cysteine desulfurase